MTDIKSCASVREEVTIKPHLKDSAIESTHSVKRGHRVEQCCNHTESLGVQLQ